MRLKTEEIITAGKILFVFRKKDALITTLEKKLTRYNFDIFSSSDMPPSTRQFSYVFVFNDIEATNKIISTTPQEKTTCMIVLYNRKKYLERLRQALNTINRTHTRVINIDPENDNSRTTDTILWFLFSKSSEQVLDAVRILKIKKIPKKNDTPFTFNISKKKALFMLFLVIICFEFFFILPFVTTGFFIVQSARSFTSNDIEGAKKNLKLGKPFLSAANTSYALARPLFSFFYVALFLDDMMLLENKSYMLLQKATLTVENGKQILPLLLDRNKNQLETQQLLNRIGLLKQEIADMTTTTTLVANKMDDYTFKLFEKITLELHEAETILKQVKKFMAHIDSLIGGADEKKYLILFQNNMEIRPGGGFIGSYGIITFQNYTLKDIAIEDVYDADGQLKAHIEPPFAIKTYMNQPHWFLRDSNFSPDFEKNFSQALFFLDKELGLKNFNGGAAITTTAIADIIDGFGSIYIPDYKETITKDNFYIKTQLQTESEFFAGSKQKKNFLSDLVLMLINKLNSVPPQKLGMIIKHALEEKQIVIYALDPQIQKDIDTIGYGGKMATLQCTTKENVNASPCIPDRVFPVDANIGINKANFFVKRLIRLSVDINAKGVIIHTLKTSFRNNASSSVFPGGTYKNYYELYIPKNTTVSNVLIDGVKQNKYEESIDEYGFKTIGILIEIPPKKTRDVSIEYSLNNDIKKGTSLYQLIVQKQIGASNSDFILQITLPKNIHIIDQNFSGLAKSAGLVYNTSLSTDRIFLIQLAKE